MPVLLSGNTGKSKTSVPISLSADEATHFNVFIAGGQFADKSDTVKYEPSAYNYAIFQKQKDGSVKQFRTIFSEEEILQIAERRKTKIFINHEGQLVDFDGAPVSMERRGQFRESAAQRFEEPLGVNVVRRNNIVDIHEHENESTEVPSRSVKNYTFKISGNQTFRICLPIIITFRQPSPARIMFVLAPIFQFPAPVAL